MDVRTICETLNTELNLDMGAQDFSNPHPDRVQHICRCFLVQVFQVNESTFMHLPLDLMNGEDAESAIRSDPLIILHQAMNTFIVDTQCGLEFSMCDLILPEPRKFRSFMQLFAEYVRFDKAMAPIWQETCSFYDDQRTQLEQYQNAIQEAEKKRQQASAENDSRKRRENGLRAELCPKEKELFELLSRAQALEQESEANAKRCEQEKFNQNELRVEMDSLEMQVEQLSLQLVGSPERVLKERDEYKDQLRQQREDCDRQRQKNQELASQMASAQFVEQALDRFHGAVHDTLAKEQNVIADKFAEKAEMERLMREADRKLKGTADKIKAMEFEDQEEDENHKTDREMFHSRMEELAKRKELLEKEVVELKKGGGAQPVAERQLQNDICAIRAQKIEKITHIRQEMDELGENYKAFMKCYEQKKQDLNEDIACAKKLADRLEGDVKTRDSDFNSTWNTSYGC